MSVDQSDVDLCADVVARAQAAGAEEAEAYLESVTIALGGRAGRRARVGHDGDDARRRACGC